MIDYDLKRIRGFAFDVDGVLSASTIALSDNGNDPVRTCNIKDGYALQLAVKRGLQVAIISGARSAITYKRYAALGVQRIYQQVSVKLPVYEDWLAETGLKAEETLYMGDDIPDYEVMKRCGLACCPADADAEIRMIARYVSPLSGGYGCVRDVIEQVLRAQGIWLGDKTAFGW